MFLSVLFFALIIPSTYAISTDLKETYQPGETLIIEISGNILQPISSSDIEFKRGHILVPFSYDIKRIGDRYFLYAILPATENNYTLFINNIQTTISGNPAIINFNQSFSISGELISYSVSPGFFITSKDIQFIIRLNKDLPETISLDFPAEHQIVLQPGENIIDLSISSVESGFRKINLGIYQIPLLILDETSSGFTQQNINPFPPKIESIILSGKKETYPFKIINSGNFPASNFEFIFNPDIFEINPSTISTITPNSSIEFNLTIKTINVPIYENITISSGDYSRDLIINISYTENESETNTPYLEAYEENSGYYCSELSGVFCSADEVCSSSPISALDGQCCTGTCDAQSETSYAWIGWVIGVIILIVLIWIFFKYKKSGKKGNDKLNDLMNKTKPSPISPIKSPITSMRQVNNKDI